MIIFYRTNSLMDIRAKLTWAVAWRRKASLVAEDEASLSSVMHRYSRKFNSKLEGRQVRKVSKGHLKNGQSILDRRGGDWPKDIMMTWVNTVVPPPLPRAHILHLLPV
jgi:hypothetical protein